MTDPTVTVLIPARDEAADIADCLNAVLAQDFPLDEIEVVLVDGASGDDTVAVARSCLDGRGLAGVTIVDNPAGSTPTSLNLGLEHARGEILVRVDARSLLPSHYVRRVVEVLSTRPDVSVVGGAQVAAARDHSAMATGIARALNNRWGMGLARYRRASSSGPTDTVYLGAFRSRELRAAGGWDERFATNQDFELNRRLGASGVVWFEASLAVDYRPRADLAALFAQYQRFGRWKVTYWRTTGDRPRARQLVLLGSPLLLVVAAALWCRLVRRPIRRGAVVGAAAAVAFEASGSSGPPGGVPARAVSVVASAVIASGWLSGVWRGLSDRGR